MSHTPEPWTSDFTDEGDIELLIHSNGKVICVFPKVENVVQGAEQDANINRIIDAVNGCAGLNPAGYRGCVEALKDVVAAFDEEPITGDARLDGMASKARQALALAASQS